MNSEELALVREAVRALDSAALWAETDLLYGEQERAENRIRQAGIQVCTVLRDVGLPLNPSSTMDGDDGGGTEANQEPSAGGDSLRVTDSAARAQRTATAESLICRRIVP